MPFDVVIHITEDSQRGLAIQRIANEERSKPEQVVDLLIEDSIKSRPMISGKRKHGNVTETPTMRLMRSWLELDGANDPREIQQAEQELNDFKRGMKQPRKEAGATLLYPDAE